MRQTQASILMLSALGLTATGCSNQKAKTAEPKQPNVIVILADDLGYGDVSAHGQTILKTPNMDRLAKGGVMFTDGHCTSATSTPSRYGLLTGSYPWKNPRAKILAGDAPLLISTEQPTFPKMMRAAGYATGAIGKWHLGIGAGNPNWNETIHPNANDIGFDFSCLIAATNDRVPTVYVENGAVVNLDPNDPIEVSYKKNFEGQPTAITNPELCTTMTWAHGHNNTVINGIPRIGYMKGGKSALWVDEDMADYFLGKVKNYISENKEKPFFLYYGLHQPHVPRAPHSRFLGKSGIGRRGDAILEADWCVGQLLDYLEAEGILENTMIVFSSDNGPVLNDGYKDGAKENEPKAGHKAAGALRGGKYSLFEAGTRVPFFVYWKGTIQPTVSNAMMNQLDLMASVAKLVGAECPAGLDTQEHLDAFMGKSQKGRDAMVLEAGGKLAYRSGNYALLPPYKGKNFNQTGNELGNLGRWAMFDVAKDVSQTTEIQDNNKELVEKLKADFLKETKGYFNPNQKNIKLK